MNRLAIALCVLLLAARAYGAACTDTDGQMYCPNGFSSDNDLPSTAYSTTAPQFSVGYDATNKLNVSATSGGDVTLAPSGDVLTFQNAVDSTTGFQVLDADGGTPILNVDTTNERVGINTTPGVTTRYGIRYPSVHIDSTASIGYGLFLERKDISGSSAPLIGGFGQRPAGAAVALNDWLMSLLVWGWDGSDYSMSAGVNVYVDGTVANNSIPSRVVISTTPVGATDLVERLVVKSTGLVGLATTAPDKPLEVNAATGGAIRLTYNDSNGTAANYVDQSVTSGGDLTVAPSGGNVALSAVLDIGAYASPITLEGATANEFETTIAVTDPTADQTATLPNATGTVVLSSYGEMVLEAESAWTLTDEDTYYANADLATGSVSGAGYVTFASDPNTGVDSLEIGANGAGVYLVNAATSFTGANSQEYECALFVEGVEDTACEF